MQPIAQPNAGTPEHLLALAISCLDIPRRSADASYSDLVAGIGYHIWRKRITRAVFEAAFRACPEKMADWLRWSEDQRWAPSWYIEDNGASAVVGYYAPDIVWPDRKRKYADRTKAYAVFVKHILDGIARRIDRNLKWSQRS